MTKEELEAIRNYGPSGSLQETRAVVDSHLSLLAKLDRIEGLCLATKKDPSEPRWARMFATDVLKVIDPNKDWEQVAYG